MGERNRCVSSNFVITSSHLHCFFASLHACLLLWCFILASLHHNILVSSCLSFCLICYLVSLHFFAASSLLCNCSLHFVPVHCLFIASLHIFIASLFLCVFRAHVRVVSLCRHRRKKFPRKYSPSLKCTGLPNEGKFCKGNASFAHDKQNSTLSYGINNSTLSFL